MNQGNDVVDLKNATKRLSTIPSIGPKVGMMLAEIGISNVSDLIGRNPEVLYEAICKHRGEKLDRCVLYHFRCAVYFASNDVHEAKLLKWWHWKDDQ